jgi:diaminopimelate epimerase
VSHEPPGRTLPLVKAHALGNDFLLLDAATAAVPIDPAALARRLCDRHRGIGADGLIIFTPTAEGASSRLLNADGSPSEVSGNGVRCLAALLARARELTTGSTVAIATDAGTKRLTLVSINGPRLVFRARMGPPADLREVQLDVNGAQVTAVVLRVGNPQCVVLGPATEERLVSIASRLAVHPFFPEGTNVELATVESPDRIRILIWERGVGPTEASGTGACAAAVAAAAYGGASRSADVIAPGGVQHVEWTGDDILLTGWAEVIATVNWWTGAA